MDVPANQPELSTTKQMSRWRLFHSHSWLSVLALVIAGILAIPVFGVIWSIFQTGDGNWPHLVDTVLPQYIQNSLILMLGVGVGVSLLGVGTAWLVVMCRFPGRRIFEWSLIYR